VLRGLANYCHFPLKTTLPNPSNLSKFKGKAGSLSILSSLPILNDRSFARVALGIDPPSAKTTLSKPALREGGSVVEVYINECL
jgi:hypothetical protein